MEITEYPDPRGLNTLKLEIPLEKLRSPHDYVVVITLTSDAGESRTRLKVPGEHGFYSPMTGTGMTPHPETSTEGTELSYVIELLEDGSVVDTDKGTIDYEEDYI